MKLTKLLDFIQCPYCEAGGLSIEGLDRLVCGDCQIHFDVIEGIPVLLRRENLSGHERSQKEWFEDHYSRFSEDTYRLENWRLSMLKRILGTTFSSSVQNYADLGCGATGYTVIEATRRLGCTSFGIDISLEAMVRAQHLAQKEGVGDKTAFMVCSAENLPLKANLFDYVSAISLLEHLENDLRVMASMSRIVKRGGHIYICVPNTYRRIWPWLWPIYLSIDQVIGHQRHYSIEGLDEKMGAEGFRQEGVVYNGHLIKLVQLVLEKSKLLVDSWWWKLEERDLNQHPISLQFNAIYTKL